MNERISYILTSLDMHLSGGMEPLAAIVATVEDYRDVYMVDDARPVIARAANVALKRMGKSPIQVDKDVVTLEAGTYLERPLADILRGAPPTHEAIAVEWMCTECEWNGHYGDTIGVMYRGVDWQQCPVCRSVAIPATGSTRYIGDRR